MSVYIGTNPVKILVMLMTIVGVLLGGSITSFAQDYYQPAQTCPANAKTSSMQVGGTPPEILPTCRFDQGDTGTCTFNAVSATLTSLIKQDMLDRGQAASNDVNVDVMGLIEGLGGNLDSSSSTSAALWKARSLKMLPNNSQKISLGQINEWDSNANPCLRDDQIVASPSTVRLAEQSKALLEQHQRERNLAKNQLPLPPFNVEVHTRFDTVDEIRNAFVDYFTKSKPSLPLILSTCAKDPCKENGHAIAATDLLETRCLFPDGHQEVLYSIGTINSGYGSDSASVLDLESLMRGMLNRGGILKVSACGGKKPRCVNHLANEGNPKSDALGTYAASGDARALDSLVNRFPEILPKKGDVPGLTQAILSGHTNVVQVFLKHGVDPNEVKDADALWEHILRKGSPEMLRAVLKSKKIKLNDRDEISALVLAVSLGRVDTVKTLLEFGADPNLGTKMGPTPLQQAAMTGDETLTRLLLKSGALVNSIGSIGATPLDLAKNDHVKTILAEAGGKGSLDSQYLVHVIPLLESLFSGHVKELETALEKDKSFIDGIRFRSHVLNPLCVAIQKANLEVVRVLLRNGAKTKVECPGEKISPLEKAIQSENEDIALALLEEGGAKPDHTFEPTSPKNLETTTFAGMDRVVAKLLEKGAKPDAWSRNDQNALIVASTQPDQNTAYLMTKALLDHGANPNGSENGPTPLSLAIGQDRLAVARLLIDAGADVNHPKDRRLPALAEAIRKGDLLFVRYLLRKGANPWGMPGLSYYNYAQEILPADHFNRDAILRILSDYMGATHPQGGHTPLPAKEAEKIKQSRRTNQKVTN